MAVPFSLKRFLFSHCPNGGTSLISFYVDGEDISYAKKHYSQWTPEALNDPDTKYCLNYSLDTVYQACKESLEKQGVKIVNLDEFRKHLEKNNIFVIDRFEENWSKLMTPLKRLADALEISWNNISKDGKEITSRCGSIKSTDEGLDLEIKAPTVRQFSAWKKKLAFMSLIRDGGDGGEFSLDRIPTSEEAAIIRNIVGVKKSKGRSR